MYAHSHGLEGLVAREQVRIAADVSQFLENQLTWAVLPSDGVALLNAHAAAAGDLPRCWTWTSAVCAEAATGASERLHPAWTTPAGGDRRPALSRVGREDCASHPPGGEPEGGWAPAVTHAQYQERVSCQEAPGNRAVALGVAAATLDIPPEQTLLLFCHSHAAPVLGAALRLLHLTHTDAQGHPALPAPRNRG